MLNKARKTVLALPTKKRLLLATGFAVILICIIAVLISITQPQRTVANFCQAAKDEKSNFQANTNYSILLDAFKKLDAVAPNEIHADTSLVANGYQSIVSDPSKVTTTELGMANSQLQVSDYITKNCPNY